MDSLASTVEIVIATLTAATFAALAWFIVTDTLSERNASTSLGNLHEPVPVRAEVHQLSPRASRRGANRDVSEHPKAA